MAEEHGYQRSGKKCKEKIDNLYKYYKKTKEGRSGRQDGKTYRFFKQLEALYGETNHISGGEASAKVSHNLIFNDAPDEANDNDGLNETSAPACIQYENLNMSYSSDFWSTSTEKEVLADEMKVPSHNSNFVDNKNSVRRYKRGCNDKSAKIREFIHLRIKKFMDMQEEWFERMLRTLEDKEQDRLRHEEEWRKQESARLHLEHKHLVNKRAWVEARDAVLLEAIMKLNDWETVPQKSPSRDITSMETCKTSDDSNTHSNQQGSGISICPASDFSAIVNFSSSLESRFMKGKWPRYVADNNSKHLPYVTDADASSCIQKPQNIYFDKADNPKCNGIESSRFRYRKYSENSNSHVSWEYLREIGTGDERCDCPRSTVSAATMGSDNSFGLSMIGEGGSMRSEMIKHHAESS